MKHYRKITINNKKWSYRIGKDHAVIFTPDKTKHVVQAYVLGEYRYPHDLDESRYNRSSCIRPAHVRKYILNTPELLQHV